MASKKELEEQVKQLKAKLFAAQDTIEELNTKKEGSSDLSEVGFSVVKQDKKYRKVKLAFDLESGDAKVVDVQPIDRLDTDFSVALMRAKQFLVEEIFSKFDVR